MRRPRSEGFSLLELTVSLVLVALVFVLATRLLTDIHLASVGWRRVAPDPIPHLAVQLLRADVHHSRRIVALPPGATGALALELPDGRQVRYERVLDSLVRSLLEADGTEIGRRDILTAVDSWSWRELSPGLVEAQIFYRRHEDPAAGGPRSPASLRSTNVLLDSVTVRFALRSRAGRRSW